jgi:hypothetical protein
VNLRLVFSGHAASLCHAHNPPASDRVRVGGPGACVRIAPPRSRCSAPRRGAWWASPPLPARRLRGSDELSGS